MGLKNNKTIQKAKIEMHYLTGDEEVKRLAELHEKWEMDYNSAIFNAKEEGLEKRKDRRKDRRKKSHC